VLHDVPRLRCATRDADDLRARCCAFDHDRVQLPDESRYREARSHARFARRERVGTLSGSDALPRCAARHVRTAAGRSRCERRDCATAGLPRPRWRAEHARGARPYPPGCRGLGLWGPVGTGKTHAIAAYLRAARERLIPGVLLPASSLQLQLESAQRFSNHETSGALVARYVQIPILALDDVDKLLPTSPSVALAIYELLDARWREERPLCLTCNVEPRDLAGVVFERFERHGVAIDDRWLDMTDWAAYPGASRRGQRVPAEAR